MPSTEDCKRILFKLGMKYGVSPNLISTRLLDASDKQSMLDGELDAEVLNVAVRCWIDAGIPDYANGSGEPYDFKYRDALAAREKESKL